MHNVLAVSKRRREVGRPDVAVIGDVGIAVRAIAGHVFGHDDTALIGEGGPAQLALAPAVGLVDRSVEALVGSARCTTVGGVPARMVAVYARGTVGIRMPAVVAVQPAPAGSVEALELHWSWALR